MDAIIAAICKLTNLAHFRLVSREYFLFDPFMCHFSSRLESLRVLILEIIIDPLKFSLFSSVFPNLEQIYLLESQIRCSCTTDTLIDFSSLTFPKYPYLQCFLITTETILPRGQCRQCMHLLTNALNTFERLPKIRYVTK